MESTFKDGYYFYYFKHFSRTTAFSYISPYLIILFILLLRQFHVSLADLELAIKLWKSLYFWCPCLYLPSAQTVLRLCGAAAWRQGFLNAGQALYWTTHILGSHSIRYVLCTAVTTTSALFCNHCSTKWPYLEYHCISISSPRTVARKEPDLGNDTQQTTCEASMAGSAPLPHHHSPTSTRYRPAAPTRAPQSRAERAQSPPHLLVVLHEAADPLALDLPFRLLQLLPPLLLLVLPVAVFFLPAIEAPHGVGSGSLTQRINRFAHGGGDQDPRRPWRETALASGYLTQDAKTACGESAGAHAQGREPAPRL